MYKVTEIAFQAEKELVNIDRKKKLIGDAAPKILQSF